MALQLPQNHKLIWTNLLSNLGVSSSSTWLQIIAYLYKKQHAFSNYSKCLRRNHEQVREDVFEDKRVKAFISRDEVANRERVNKILDEMCHLMASQTTPTRSIKFLGAFFVKCITKVYSQIYVNNHLLPLHNGYKLEDNLFRQQYLRASAELPIVMLPTHRSYMDFLFLSYIMLHYELPLPIVATGDNFKSMGKILTNYLKSTGGFLVRRAAHRKNDVDANDYYDILRAYVHSVVRGGENPMEFFMEGTRTRVGQVLRPKTGLLSMVVDLFIDKVVDDVFILPVAINYQRPIEEQLYIGENTPQIDMEKPKESAKNLYTAFDAIMKRNYGKVYVRFFEPFKLSSFFNEWKSATNNTISLEENGGRDKVLHEFTNSLASKVCLAQANNNTLMPFNLLTCAILARSFLQLPNKKNFPNGRLTSDLPANRSEASVSRVPFDALVKDFNHIEELLQSTQSQFAPGWESKLEILDEFKLDRDGIVRSTADRRFVEFDNDALTFQTMLYYSNQLVQILLPVAICSLLLSSSSSGGGVNGEPKTPTNAQWEQYKSIRNLLSREFFANEIFMRKEFEEAYNAIRRSNISQESKQIVIKHLSYFLRSYLVFLNYLKQNGSFERSRFFKHEAHNNACRPEDLFISKDMLKNMISLVKESNVCVSVVGERPNGGVDGQRVRRVAPCDGPLRVSDFDQLDKLSDQFQQILNMATNVINASSSRSQAEH